MADPANPSNRKSPRIEVYAQAEVRGQDISIMAVRNVSAGGVYVNGVKLSEPYIRQTPDYALPPTVVPPGQVFVLGDNRRNSQDSHAFGPIQVERIIGSAFVSYWPQDRWGFIPHPTYAEMANQPQQQQQQEPQPQPSQP